MAGRRRGGTFAACSDASFTWRAALDQYVTALEGGRTTESTTRLVRTGTGAGGFDAKLVSASGEKSREEEESRTLADTDEARFDRLLRAAASQPEVLGWTEVMQPDTDLAGIGLEPCSPGSVTSTSQRSSKLWLARVKP